MRQNALESLENRQLLAFTASVNFQPASAVVPVGYVVDSGKTYGNRGNGLSYGWNAANNTTRDRNSVISPDQRHDTFIHLQKGGTFRWELSVPAGWYDVKVVCGDAGYFDSNYRIDAEGALVVADKPTSQNRFVTGTVRVKVTDGKLTLKPATGATNAKICFVNVTDASSVPDAQLQAQISHAFEFASSQMGKTLMQINNSASTYVERTGSDGPWKTTTNAAWTAGFLPGEMWQLFTFNGDNNWRDKAIKWLTPLASRATVDTGDLAFKFMTSTLPYYQLTGNATARQTLINAADQKMKQWNETVGAFKTTWFTTKSGNPDANFPVLLDMTTDMSLLLWAADETGNALYRTRAISHMEKVVQYIQRADGSTSHFAMFNSTTGAFVLNETYQGYANDSTWSRGQAWAILSFTDIAHRTGRADFLLAAQKAADWYLDHLPADFVPYWDFSDPTIPNTYRDSSAAAVSASGLIQLSRITLDPILSLKYKTAAENILKSLLSQDYLAEGTVHRGVLNHGASNIPNNIYGRDCSLIYGDYYLLEAMNRYMELPLDPVP